jgi:hypothetical protein
MDLFGELQISLSRKRRKQVEPLENKADLSTPDIGPLRVRDFRQIFAIDDYRTACRTQKPTEQMQQCRFAAARRAHDRNEFSFRDIEGDAAKSRDLQLPELVRLG